MKKGANKRVYTMGARAEQVARNERKILKATAQLWKKYGIQDLTLEKIAERSGVTVRTILRKFGSKEGLLEACIEEDAGDWDMLREGAAVGDLEGILHHLLREYEEMGDAVVRTLSVEEQLPIAHKLLSRGRAYHRAWCMRVFAPYLPAPGDPRYEERLLAFITATEIYLWKLLRRDLGKSPGETTAVFRSLLEGLIGRFRP